MSDLRARARALAQRAVAEGRPTRWFDELYREAERGDATIPWADREPNPHLMAWLARRSIHAGRALDVGSGLGDNAEALASLGYEVTAFDVSASAVAQTKRRFPDTRVDYQVADVLALPSSWRGAFDLVVEVYTLQVLPPEPRALAARAIASCVAANGTLVVIARIREDEESEGQMPWPLTRREVEAVAGPGLVLEQIEDFVDDETPPVRRIRATFSRTS